MAQPRNIAIGDFLTPAETVEVVRLFRKLPTERFAKVLCWTVIGPNLARVEAALGQQCEPMYLSYKVQAVLTRASERRRWMPINLFTITIGAWLPIGIAVVQFFK
jgi:hypothetical protein